MLWFIKLDLAGIISLGCHCALSGVNRNLMDHHKSISTKQWLSVWFALFHLTWWSLVPSIFLHMIDFTFLYSWLKVHRVWLPLFLYPVTCWQTSRLLVLLFQLLFYYCDKAPRPGRLRKCLVGFTVSEGPSLCWWKNKGMAAETAESSHLDLQAGGRENILGMVRESLEPQTLPPVTHLLQVGSTNCGPGIQTYRYRGPYWFRPPHCSHLDCWE